MGVYMGYEQRLISIGWPLTEAFGICRALRREGGLTAFVENEEKKYRESNYEYMEGISNG